MSDNTCVPLGDIRIVSQFLSIKESAEEISLKLVIVEEENTFSLRSAKGLSLYLSDNLDKVKDFLDAYKRGYKDHAIAVQPKQGY